MVEPRAFASTGTGRSRANSEEPASLQDEVNRVRSSKIFLSPAWASSNPVTSSSSSRKEDDEVHETAGAVLASQCFKISMSLLIVADSVRLGVEQSYRLHGRNVSGFHYVGQALLVFYVAEFGLRTYVLRFDSLHSGWMRFDCLLIVVNVLAHWVMEPFQPESSQVQVLIVLARLLRLIRTMRLMTRYPELSFLLRGMWFCTRNAIYAVLSITILFYVFGCMCVELIPLHLRSREDVISESVKEIINTNFESLPMAVLTLVQFMTLDDVAHIYRPLIEADEKLFLFFFVLIGIFGIFIITSLIATMVQTSIEQAALDKDLQSTWDDEKRRKLLRDLKQAFFQADTDYSGEVSREELSNLNEEDKRMLNSILGVDILRVFDCLDVNGQHRLEIDKFLDGIESVSLLHGTVHAMHMERMLESLFQQMKEAQQRQSDLRRSVQLIANALRPERLAAAEWEDCEDGFFHSASARRPNTPPGPAAGPGPRSRSGSSPGPGPENAEPQPSEHSQPLWADRLVLKVQDIIAVEMKSVLEQVCSIVVDDASLGPEAPHSMMLTGSASGASAPSASKKDVQGMEPSCWEALPPARSRLTPLRMPRPVTSLRDRADSSTWKDNLSEFSFEQAGLSFHSESPRRLRTIRADGSVPPCRKPIFLSSADVVESSRASSPAWET